MEERLGPGVAVVGEALTEGVGRDFFQGYFIHFIKTISLGPYDVDVFECISWVF